MDFPALFNVDSSLNLQDGFAAAYGDLSLCTDDVSFIAAPLVHNDNPNSSTGHSLDYETLNTPNPGCSNQLTPIDSPYGQFPMDATSTLNSTQDRHFSVSNNTRDSTASESAWRPQEPTIIEPNTARFNLFDPTQVIDYNPVFTPETPAWPDSACRNPLLGDTNLLNQLPPTAFAYCIAAGSNLDELLGLTFDAPIQIPDDILMSSDSSEPYTPEWTLESASPREQLPLFSSPVDPGSLADDFTTLGHPPPLIIATPPPPPAPPPSPLGVIRTKYDTDGLVAALKSRRRHRGAGPSLIKLKCPFEECGTIHRRPHALQEHIDSVHHGLSREPFDPSITSHEV
ncbi:hypothetical protein FRC07_010202 [Ceratobasidium sp. 392]|nr:hypothetical protein FRC07_010202 [Ceratobasidium sp. 392]